MKCDHLSPSRNNKYESCPLRYHANYELGIKDSMTSSKNIGLLAHKAFELYYNPANFGVSAEDCFAMASSHTPCPDMKAFADAKEMFLTVAKMGGDRTKMNIIGSEIGIDFFTAAGTRLKGFIDRLEIADSQTVRITDYKTGMWVPPLDELVGSHQSKMYGLWVYSDPRFSKFSKVRMRYTYPRVGEDKEFEIDRADMVPYVEYLEHLHHHILGDTKHLPSLNQFCYNCGYRDRCPEYITIVNALVAGGTITRDKDTVMQEPAEDTLETFVRIKNAISNLDKEKDLFSSWALNKLKYSGEHGVVIGQNKFTVVRKNITKCDQQLMKNLLYKYSAVDKALDRITVGDMEKIFEGNRDALQELKRGCESDLGAPYIMVKKTQIPKEKK